MHLTNLTPFQTAYAGGLRPDGRELLVVVVKATYDLPTDDQAVPALAALQEPIVAADAYVGEPGLSAPLYESDFAPCKPRCDVLLHGAAHAPLDRVAERVTVAFRVGAWSKSFDVVGRRIWQVTAGGIRASSPEPFRSRPISYGLAFGGAERSSAEIAEHVVYEPNPVGIGFHVTADRAAIDGRPLPASEESSRPITSPDGDYAPMAFGPIGRNWGARRRLAGTFDQHWRDHVFPFLPADFDEHYYQAAPPDQWTDHLRGGETVELIHLTADGERRFQLPDLRMPITFVRRTGEFHDSEGTADTLIVEPDLGRFSIVWRASLPLKRDIFEVNSVIVGRQSTSRRRAQSSGKTWHASLKHLIDAKRADGRTAHTTNESTTDTSQTNTTNDQLESDD